MKLSGLSTGERALIKEMKNDAIASKLISMGVSIDATAEVVNKTWMGKTMYVRINTLRLALLASEADTILVEKIES